MVSVAFITILGQFLATTLLIRSEARKIRYQFSLDRERQLHHEWNNNLRDSITQLLYETDIEAQSDAKKVNIMKLMHKLNLMLDDSIQDQKILNAAINKLALASNGWEKVTQAELLSRQSAVIVAGKVVIYRPGAITPN